MNTDQISKLIESKRAELRALEDAFAVIKAATNGHAPKAPAVSVATTVRVSPASKTRKRPRRRPGYKPIRERDIVAAVELLCEKQPFVYVTDVAHAIGHPYRRSNVSAALCHAASTGKIKRVGKSGKRSQFCSLKRAGKP